ncbi:MAG: hypothetical protein KAH31_10030, partial [Candidatus Sabulitectum sp.]|nr:hypothetical protein [Candidatus Sabulitectum sp.]
MSRLKELAESSNPNGFKTAWEDALNNGVPAKELLESLIILKSSMEGRLPLHLAELAVERMDSENRGDVLEFASGAAKLFEHSSVIAGSLVEALRDKFLVFEPLEIFVSASGISSEKKLLRDSWKRLEELLRYQKGSFIFHKDFGPGEILRVSRSSFTIDFQRSRNHDMTVEATIDLTHSIPDDSLYVQRWKQHDAFAALLTGGGEKLLKKAFRDTSVDNSLREVNLLKLLDGSDVKPREMWRVLKTAAADSNSFMDMGDAIIPADSSSLLAQVEAVLTLKKMPMSEKTKTVTALIKAAPNKEEALLEQIFDRVISLKDIEKGAVFELAWLCSSRGKIKKFGERTGHLLEMKAVRVLRSIGEIHSMPCRKLYMKHFFANSPEEMEIQLLLDKLPRTLREQAADLAVEFSPEVHSEYVLKALDDPRETAHFMWALERAAKMENYMEPEKIVELALKNLLFAKTEMQKRVCSVLMNKLRPELEQHISLLDTRRLGTLT